MPTALNPHHLTWYMNDISMHALGARLAFEAMLIVLEDGKTRQSRLVWFHLTSFLHHAAMISKFLQASPKKEVASARAKALRDALGVGSDSEVLPRDARDNVEHFDQRMDRWIDDSNPMILESVLDDREGYDYLQAADRRVKRLLIADELVFVSERMDGTKFELWLRPVHAEIERIGIAAEDWMRLSSPYAFVHPRRQ